MSPTERHASLNTLVDTLRGRLETLVVCLSYSWGGLEQVAASDALDVAALGLPVRVLCLEGTPIHEQLAKRKELAVVPLNFRPRNHFDLKLRAELRDLIGQGVNLVHTHQTSILGSIVPWLWHQPNVALLATRHIMSGHAKRDFYHRFLYSRVDKLMVISQAVRKNVLATHPVSERRVKVVNLGLDFDRFDPERVDPAAQRADWGADADTCVIGLVGRIDPAKGQGTFIKAAAGLLKNSKENEKLRFVIVGEETRGGEARYVEELKRMVQQFRLENHVVFAGFHGNIPEVMRSFDIFVMPSRQEAFGLVAIEAMAMECPIIISNSGSAEEIVGTIRRTFGGGAGGQPGETEFGLIVRPNDAFDLQKQLRYLLDHPKERIEMGKRGRRHVVANYDRKARLRRTLELYERALRRRGI